MKKKTHSFGGNTLCGCQQSFLKTKHFRYICAGTMVQLAKKGEAGLVKVVIVIVFTIIIIITIIIITIIIMILMVKVAIPAIAMIDDYEFNAR